MAKARNSTRNDLDARLRERMIGLLNQQLADTLDLYTQVKQAHWNVKGPHFIARGTARVAADESRLPELPLGSLDGLKLTALLADRYAALAKSTRTAIDNAGNAGDADTADLFTGISRGLDKALWFLEAHLQ